MAEGEERERDYPGQITLPMNRSGLIEHNKDGRVMVLWSILLRNVKGRLTNEVYNDCYEAFGSR